MTPERKHEVLEMIDDAIDEEDQSKSTNITRIPDESSLEVLDVLWEVCVAFYFLLTSTHNDSRSS